MFCIDNRTTDIHANLAAEEYLLKARTEDFFMLWQSAPSVVLGKFQSVRAEVDTEFIRREGIGLARRFSGGGAVYHDAGNLNLTFIQTVDNPDFARYLYAVMEALEQLGVAVEADHRKGIFAQGAKISGSAQCIYKNRVLYHCTLLFQSDLPMLEAALQGAPRDESIPETEAVRAVRSVRSPVVNIGELLPWSISIDGFRERIFDHFLHGDRDNARYRFNGADAAAIERLRAGKYATPEWIYNKS